ncbi:hypothetical protein Scep_005554 [Stephania cephalantha]|uniref:3-oxo-5-alpha-steroid 4-dehydrogenase C-terminal domain-containing protein n=1 Tax=Stephania cephalantha TaxID=152367 RepID=A0AAP0PXL3_9MAGN
MKMMESSDDDERLYNYSLLFLYVSGICNLFILQFLQAPYGKHFSPRWGPAISPTLAWLLMESPSVFLTLLLFPRGLHSSSPRSLSLISLFLLHYLHRTFVYPFRLPPSSNKTPISIALLAFSFNLLNSYLQSRSISHYVDYDAEGGMGFWARFLGGLLVFLWGMSVNVRSDLALVRLRGEGRGYRVPRGGGLRGSAVLIILGRLLSGLGGLS